MLLILRSQVSLVRKDSFGLSLFDSSLSNSLRNSYFLSVYGMAFFRIILVSPKEIYVEIVNFLESGSWEHGEFHYVLEDTDGSWDYELCSSCKGSKIFFYPDLEFFFFLYFIN